MKRLGTMMVFCVLTAVATAAADGLEAAQSRMRQRLVRIGELKLAKVIGETHDGYLAVADAARADAATQAVVQEENADRTVVYRAVAARAGTDVGLVGVQRALTIREQSVAGLLFRDEAGAWHEKQ